MDVLFQAHPCLSSSLVHDLVGAEWVCTKLPQPQVVVVQSLSCIWLFATPWTAAHQASLFFTISWSLLKLMSIESVMPSNHLIFCRLFSSCPQSFPEPGSFPVSQLFASGGQSIGAWASAAHVCSSCVYVTWNYKAGMEDTSFVPCPCFALLIFLFYWLLVLWISDLLIQPPQSHELILQNLPFFLPSFPSSLFPSFYPFSLSFCLSFSLCLFFPIYLISLEFKH